MPTFGAWESTVLELAYEQVDHVSAHAYYEADPADPDSFLASAADMDRTIEAVTATADAVGARLRSPKRITVSFDEWNVWYHSRLPRWLPRDWTEAPPISEDDYTAADAVVVGNLLISLLRHTDRVAAACQAQLVNAIAPIRAEPGGPAWRQSIFHPFALTARLARGEVLRVALEAPRHDTARHGTVPLVDAVATHDPDAGAVAVFAVNRDRARPARLALDHGAFPGYRVTGHTVLTHPDPAAVNSADAPGRVVPRSVPVGPDLILPPVSWNAIVLGRTPAAPQQVTEPGEGERRGGGGEA
jgi:alpha-N-arabinofuranosidase